MYMEVIELEGMIAASPGPGIFERNATDDEDFIGAGGKMEGKDRNGDWSGLLW